MPPTLRLREPRPTDRDALLALHRASRGQRHAGTRLRTAADFDAWLARARRDDHAGWLLCRHDDGAIVGTAEISQIARGNFQSAYLGYRIFSPYEGRRYMTEALSLVLDHAFRRLRLHRLEANVQPDNAASIALLGRAGFRQEGFSPRYLKIGGRWRDHERWAILREEWEAGRPGGRATRTGGFR